MLRCTFHVSGGKYRGATCCSPLIRRNSLLASAACSIMSVTSFALQLVLNATPTICPVEFCPRLVSHYAVDSVTTGKAETCTGITLFLS